MVPGKRVSIYHIPQAQFVSFETPCSSGNFTSFDELLKSVMTRHIFSEIAKIFSMRYSLYKKSGNVKAEPSHNFKANRTVDLSPQIPQQRLHNVWQIHLWSTSWVVEHPRSRWLVISCRLLCRKLMKEIPTQDIGWMAISNFMNFRIFFSVNGA